MEYQNYTTASEFILLGLSSLPHLQVMFFLLCLAIYTMTLSGNILLLLLVISDTHLHTPMYFFLCKLSFIDICFSTTVTPKLMDNTLGKKQSISFQGCAVQMFFHLALGSTECFILAVMAWDRYVAICHPLRYVTIVSKIACLQLSGSAWTFSILNSAFHVYITLRLPYCRSNYVDHYLCEVPAVLRLACADTTFNQIMRFISSAIIAVISFILTLVSYVHILKTILNINSAEGRSKAFSTCGSHLTVVSMYYGTLCFMYMRPQSSYIPKSDKVLSLLYTVVIPMLNPIIYSMRNKEVKGAFRRAMSRKMWSFRR